MALTSWASAWTLCFFCELPVSDPFYLTIGDAIGQPGHGVGSNIAAMGHDGCQDDAHLFRFALLGYRAEVVGEVQFVIHLNQ